MATPGTFRPLFPIVWRIDLLWEMGPAGFAERFFLFFLSCIYSTDWQHGFLGFGKTVAVFLIVSTNVYLFGGPPRRHLESRHIESSLGNKACINITLEKLNFNLAGTPYMCTQYILKCTSLRLFLLSFMAHLGAV